MEHFKSTINTTFLGLQVDNHLIWKNHIDQMVPKLSGTCYAVRSMNHISNIDILKSIYFAYFHSIIKYGIIFGGIPPTVRRYSPYKRKSSELLSVQNQELHAEVCLKN
jgi:hypothetical protein